MKITIAPAAFQPVTIVLETQDDLDQLIQILTVVSNNVINYPPPVMNTARNWSNHLKQKLIDERTTS